MNYAMSGGGRDFMPPNPSTGIAGSPAPNYLNYGSGGYAGGTGVGPQRSPGAVGSNQYGSLPPWMHNSLPQGGTLPTIQGGSVAHSWMSPGYQLPPMSGYQLPFGGGMPGVHNNYMMAQIPQQAQQAFQQWMQSRLGQQQPQNPQLSNMFQQWIQSQQQPQQQALQNQLNLWGGGQQPQYPQLSNMFQQWLGGQMGQRPQQQNPLQQYMMRQMGQTMLGGVNY